MKYEISEQVKNNILIFLDRIDYKGRKEAMAAVEIEQVLNKPIQEEGEKGDTRDCKQD